MLLFFVHRFNDIDHIVPVVYKIVKDTKRKAAILCMNPLLDITNDFRLNFLKDSYGVEVEYIYKYIHMSLKQILFSNAACSRDNILASLFKKFVIAKKERQKIFTEIYDVEWAKKFLGSLKPSILVFDHAVTERLWVAGSLFSAAKSMGIPLVAVPHGITTFSEHHPDVFSQAFHDLRKSPYDYIFIPHKRYAAECIKEGVDAKKILVMGSARYCEEWEKVLHEILPANSLDKEKTSDKLRVVYMERGADRHGKFKEVIRDTVEKIGNLDFVDFIFKPQPRSNALFFNVSPSMRVAYNENSAALIEWADIVIVTISSIIFEVMWQGKIAVEAEFFHEYKLLFQEYGVGWHVKSYQKLVDALLEVKKNRSLKPYPDENVKRFLGEFVYGGEYGCDVLTNYKNAILNIAGKSYVKQG